MKGCECSNTDFPHAKGTFHKSFADIGNGVAPKLVNKMLHEQLSFFFLLMFYVGCLLMECCATILCPSK